ncbi:hypothetical protein MKX03_012115 [Papaver bracteatum]|nr:hypothetical protein MKX03_012115 [Papaver bracteatum]
MSTSLLLCVFNVLVFSVLEITGTNKIPALIVFGDSTVDAGNNNQIPTLEKSNFLPYGQDFEGGKPTGRFCNGRLGTDFLAEMLGIKKSVPAYLDPAFGIEDFATGVTFASAATGYDVVTSDLLAVIPPADELEYFKEYLEKLTSFLGKDGAVERARESLYFISIGTNDFVFSLVLTVWLYSLGARKIILNGLPPSGYLPITKTLNHISERPNLEELNEASKDFNLKLQNVVASLSKELRGIKLVYADNYNPTIHIIHNPNLYGFENTEEGCCGTGTFETGIFCKAGFALPCPDPSKYVFWDSVHPTEKVYSIVANILMNKTLPQLLR